MREGRKGGVTERERKKIVNRKLRWETVRKLIIYKIGIKTRGKRRQGRARCDTNRQGVPKDRAGRQERRQLGRG